MTANLLFRWCMPTASILPFCFSRYFFSLYNNRTNNIEKYTENASSVSNHHSPQSIENTSKEGISKEAFDAHSNNDGVVEQEIQEERRSRYGEIFRRVSRRQSRTHSTISTTETLPYGQFSNGCG